MMMISDSREEALYRMSRALAPISSLTFSMVPTMASITPTATVIASTTSPSPSSSSSGGGKKSTSKTATFLSGGAASMVAAGCTHPLDLLKVRLQIEMAKQPASIVATTGRILRHDGFFSLYNGLSASLLRQGTYSTVRFGIYEFLKDQATQDGRKMPFYQSLMCALAAGAAGGISGNPADIVNIRMQADGKRPPAERRNYKHAVDGLVRMVRSDGMASLMSGWQPNITRAMLMTAGQLSSYDFFKAQVLAAGMKDGAGAHLTASTLAGLVACTICNPVDVVKTRIMNSEAGETRSAFETFSRVVKAEGLRGLYKGFLPAYARLGPHTIITFVVMEKFKSWL